ncbi:hypothetical protein GF356_00550 [candidate division GN15 bacterium]|nr:hypothetical protein [candidate division GN15 bacterium]
MSTAQLTCRGSVAVVLLVLLSAAVGAQTLEELREHPVRVGILGDRTGNHQGTIHTEIVHEVAALQPDLVIGVGDMIEGYTEDTAVVSAEWREYQQILIGLGDIPFYPTCGNHDLTNDAMIKPYEDVFGSPYYSWDHRGVHFVMIDNSRWWEASQIPEQQLRWIEKDLAENGDALFTIAFYHRPLWYNSTARGKPDTLHSLFVAYGVDAVVSGHFHRYFSGKYDGISYTCIGASGGGLPEGPQTMGHHFAWMTIDDSGVNIVPIRYQSTKPWDHFQAADLHFYGKLNRSAFSYSMPARISEDLELLTDSVVLSMTNHSDHHPMHDTVSWQLSESWSVTPPSTVVNIGPGETAEIPFSVKCDGQVYPAPMLTADFPYRSDASFELSTNMQLVRSASCVHAAKAPEIDGDLDDACWSRPVESFFDSEGQPAATDTTRFYFAHDDTHLYLAAWCYEPMMDQLKARTQERDGGVYADDCVGYFFYPEDPDEAVYQVYINPQGVIFDQRISPNEDGYFNGNIDFNGDYQLVTRQGSDYWTVEMAIPVAEFRVRSIGESDWKLNFRRKQQRLGSNADWQLPIDRDPRWFGILKMN